jgi:hypothetical protein
MKLAESLFFRSCETDTEFYRDENQLGLLYFFGIVETEYAPFERTRQTREFDVRYFGDNETYWWGADEGDILQYNELTDEERCIVTLWSMSAEI